MSQSARSNPLSQKQPVHPLPDVETALRQGLGGQLHACEISLELHDVGGKPHELFFIRAHGAEWSFDAEMSGSAAYSTGQAVARMVEAAGKKAKAG